jgi:hypothetical protein
MPIWILSSNIIRIISMFQSSALCLMPPQLHERVGKWTHEPRSNLNHKKHLFDTSICTLISALNYSKNIKTYLLPCIHIQNPKTSLPHHIYIYFIALLFTLPYCISYFLFIYIYTLCLTTTQWSWEHKNKEFDLQIARRRTTRAFATVPREFDINPEFPHGENLHLLQHSALGVPTWHTCLVSSVLKGSR